MLTGFEGPALRPSYDLSQKTASTWLTMWTATRRRFVNIRHPIIKSKNLHCRQESAGIATFVFSVGCSTSVPLHSISPSMLFRTQKGRSELFSLSVTEFAIRQAFTARNLVAGDASIVTANVELIRKMQRACRDFEQNAFETAESKVSQELQPSPTAVRLCGHR